MKTDNANGSQERSCLIEAKGGRDNNHCVPFHLFGNLNYVNALSNSYCLHFIGVGRGIEMKTRKKCDSRIDSNSSLKGQRSWDFNRFLHTGFVITLHLWSSSYIPTAAVWTPEVKVEIAHSLGREKRALRTV